MPDDPTDIGADSSTRPPVDDAERSTVDAPGTASGSATRTRSATASGLAETLPGAPMAELEAELGRSTPRRVLGGRYIVEALLGEGGFGRVWRGTDRHTGEAVAIKELDAIGHRASARIRRELAALRWARLPGVVRLRDDGVDGFNFFIVMDLVDGAAFPGADVTDFATLRARAIRVLEVLYRMHCAGVAHRDIKPANVLVDADGRPTLIDLGLARGQPIWPDRAVGFEGTPAYAAPEQRVGQADHRSDLYSVGVMLRRAVRRIGRSTPAGVVPGDLVALIAALTRPEPDARPQSALAALAALGQSARTPGENLAVLPDARATPDTLAGIFAGPERFFHLPSDAGRVLWRRTGGWPAAVAAEVAAWVDAGLAYWNDGRVVIERAEIERLGAGLAVAVDVAPPDLPADAQRVLDAVRADLPEAPVDRLAMVCGLSTDALSAALDTLERAELVWPLDTARRAFGARPLVGVAVLPPPDQGLTAVGLAEPEALRRRITRALADGQTVEPELFPRIARCVQAQLDSGRPDLALLTIGIDLARAAEDLYGERVLLQVFVKHALTVGTAGALSEARYLLDRAQAEATRISELVQAAQAVSRGDRERARTLYAQLRPFEDEQFDIRRQAVLVQAAVVESADARLAVLEGMRTWASSDGRRAAWLKWRGLLAHMRGDYDSAAADARAAAALAPTVGERLQATVNAAIALLDALVVGEARSEARRARHLARRLRRPHIEAYAWWIERTAAYRSGAELEADPDGVQAGRAASAQVGAVLAMTEAAIAWRAADIEALALARRAADWFAETVNTPAANLMRALVARITGDRSDLDCLVDYGMQCPIPELGAQIIGLLAPLAPGANLSARIDDLAIDRPPRQWSARLDVLSLDECRGFDSKSR